MNTRTVLRTAALLVALCGVSTLGAAAQRWIPMDDVDQWQAQAFCGSPTVRWFLQGPKFEGGASGVVVVDSKGTAYVACGTFIQEVRGDTARVLTGAPGITGNTDGPPGRATFGNAIDIAMASDDLMYVVDAANFTLRKLERKAGVWITSTVAGTPRVKGHRDGRGERVRFTNPFESLIVTEKGVVYLCDGNWLRKVEDGVVTTLNAGSGYVNGPLKTARFSRSQGRRSGMAYDGKGNLYIADKLNMAIRKVDLKKGIVTTIAGVLPGQKKDRPRDGKAMYARFHPGGGPNIAFYDRVHDQLIVRSDDEGGIRVIKGGWVKTFGGVPARRTKSVGPWREVSGGVPLGVDRWGGVYVSGPGGTIRVVRKKGDPRPPTGVGNTREAVEFPEFKWPVEPGDEENIKLAPRLSMSGALQLPPPGKVLHRRSPAVAYAPAPAGNNDTGVEKAPTGAYLVVWQEGFSGLSRSTAKGTEISSNRIVGLRFDDGGFPVDQKVIQIARSKGPYESPAVAYCGGRFLVAWSDHEFGSHFEIFARFVDAKRPRSSPIEEARHIHVSARDKGGPGRTQAHPAVAWNGRDQALVVWQDYRSGKHFGVYGARIDVRTGKILDKGGFEILGRGERPRVVRVGGKYLVSQKYYAALVDDNGKVSETQRLHSPGAVVPSAVAAAWGRAHLFLNMVPSPDPWGWGGNGGVLGVRIGPDGRSAEPPIPGSFKRHLALAADGKLPNGIDAARWANHHGWPMGMPGGFKSTHEGTWPSGPLAAAFNGTSLIAVWPRAKLMDRRRLANRDLYLRRTYDGWAFVDKVKIKIAAGPTEETNPVLCAGKQGDVLLAYEKVVPEGVAIELRLIREEPDKRGPRVAWTAPLSDTKMIVAFDEPVDPATAAQAGNYAIQGIRVKAATFVADPRAGQREVILETEPQTRGKTYSLRVEGVRDRSSAANVTHLNEFQYVAKPGTFERSRFVARWAVTGPFDRDWKQTPVDPKTVHPTPGRDGWKAAACHGGVVLDFRRAVAGLEGKSAVANTYIFSDRPRRVIVRIDSNDDNRTWLNGGVIGADLLAPGQGRGFHTYTNEFPARLKKGWNQLTIQVGNWVGKWQLALQVTDVDKQPIPDLTWQLENPFGGGR